MRYTNRRLLYFILLLLIHKHKGQLVCIEIKSKPSESLTPVLHYIKPSAVYYIKLTDQADNDIPPMNVYFLHITELRTLLLFLLFSASMPTSCIVWFDNSQCDTNSGLACLQVDVRFATASPLLAPGDCHGFSHRKSLPSVSDTHEQ